jgi:hypothetical protein
VVVDCGKATTVLEDRSDKKLFHLSNPAAMPNGEEMEKGTSKRQMTIPQRITKVTFGSRSIASTRTIVIATISKEAETLISRSIIQNALLPIY